MKQKLFFLLIATWLIACNSTSEPTPEQVSATEASVSPTEAPVSPTEAPVSPTEAPASATEAPASATEAPASPTEEAASPTEEAANTPLPSDISTPEPSNTDNSTKVQDYINNPPVRQGSPERQSVGRRKHYPPGSYEFIHDQFSVPQPPGEVPADYVASLPGVESGICPLTGETGSPELIKRRPINVRLDNSPQGRPQAGIYEADVVWEALAEGGLTRLSATYHCRTPGVVGPIRSARLIDLQLTPMLDAWLVHAGAAQPVTDMIWASPYADRSINEWESSAGFYRIDEAPLDWLRTYSNNDLIQGAMNSNIAKDLPASLRGWTFNNNLPDGASGNATQITIPYAAGQVNYTYNANSASYARYQGQEPHTDQSGQNLAPQNVIVIFSDMTTSTILEDSNDAYSLHFKLHGEGPALLLRNGQVWETRWIREGENALIRVVDNNNQPIPLAIGQTWVQIVPSDMNVTSQ